MKDDFWIGNSTLSIRLGQDAPTMTAASSISPESCIMELVPLREAKGRYLMAPTMISNSRVPRRKVSLVDTARKMAPKAMEGTR